MLSAKKWLFPFTPYPVINALLEGTLSPGYRQSFVPFSPTAEAPWQGRAEPNVLFGLKTGILGEVVQCTAILMGRQCVTREE